MFLLLSETSCMDKIQALDALLAGGGDGKHALDKQIGGRWQANIAGVKIEADLQFFDQGGEFVCRHLVNADFCL